MRKRPTTSYIIRFALYIIAGLVFSFVEYTWHWQWGNECEVPNLVRDSALIMREFYAHLTTLDWRRPQNLNVTVITLREDREPKEIFEPCNRREFLAKIIDEVIRNGPKSIVLDYYFSDRHCAEDEHLRHAIVSANFPIIIGKHTLNLAQLQRFFQRPLTPSELQSFSRACLVLQDNLDLQTGNLSHVHYGLLRLNDDYRKLPTSWSVFRDPNHISNQDEIEQINTIATVAALTVTKLELPRFSVHPYTSFMSQDKILTIPASQLFCKNHVEPAPVLGWRSCAESDFNFEASLRHRIVIIGDDVDSDQHETPIGPMPGVFVVANHVESLIGKGFFRPIKTIFQVIFGVAWFGFIELVYVRTHNPIIGLVVSTVGTTALWMLCLIIAISTGILPVIWVPGVIALFLRFGEAVREHSVARIREFE